MFRGLPNATDNDIGQLERGFGAIEAQTLSCIKN
jgi:hypothetical protein